MCEGTVLKYRYKGWQLIQSPTRQPFPADPYAKGRRNLTQAESGQVTLGSLTDGENRTESTGATPVSIGMKNFFKNHSERFH